MASSSVDFRVDSETFQTTHTIFGHLHFGTRPLLVLNGGPGLSHSYMLPHACLYKTQYRPVTMYDQHLRIESDSDLLGQSWGVVLAIEYVAVY